MEEARARKACHLKFFRLLRPAVAMAQGDRIYVKGLPAGMNDDAVRETFAAYGTVLDCKVLVDSGKSDDGTGQSVAIVKLGSAAEAAWAVTNLNGNIPEGLPRPIDVSYASKSRTETSTTIRASPYDAVKSAVLSMGVVPPPAPIRPPTAVNGMVASPPEHECLIPGLANLISQAGPNSKLYIKGLPLNADDLYLYKVFAPFGCVLSVKALPKDGYCIGFVQYMTDAEAAGAIEGINGQMLTDGSVLQVAVKSAKKI